METAEKSTIAELLHPKRFTGMSPKMAAIVGCIVGEKWTDPPLVALCVTSDGFLLGMDEGDIGFNDFIGSVEDLQRNWDNLLDAADLNDDQRKTAELLYRNALSRQ